MIRPRKGHVPSCRRRNGRRQARSATKSTHVAGGGSVCRWLDGQRPQRSAPAEGRGHGVTQFEAQKVNRRSLGFVLAFEIFIGDGEKPRGPATWIQHQSSTPRKRSAHARRISASGNSISSVTPVAHPVSTGCRPRAPRRFPRPRKCARCSISWTWYCTVDDPRTAMVLGPTLSFRSFLCAITRAGTQALARIFSDNSRLT